jgi:hypothetical protein
MQEFGVAPLSLISRHVRGDWGDLDEHDRLANESALREGLRIFSAYKLTTTLGSRVVHEKVWVITEADRSSTCLLRPDEY